MSGNPGAKGEFQGREQMTECRCPKCRQRHSMKLFWVGRIPADKFCPNCRNLADRCSSSFVDPTTTKRGTSSTKGAE